MMVQSEIYITDRQLCERWHCSSMKLWRLRGQGILPQPTKIGPKGRNLTPMQVVRELERGESRARSIEEEWIIDELGHAIRRDEANGQ